MPWLASLRHEETSCLLDETVKYVFGRKVRAQRGPGEGPEEGGHAHP